MQRVEQRVALLGDSETQRSQKRLAVIIMFLAVLSTALSAVAVSQAGLSEIGWIYTVQAAVIITVFFLLLGFPGSFVPLVIGRQKFIYDLWGDTVNVASRMESAGLANEIQVTQEVKDCLDGRYEFVQRGPIAVKGKGQMITYLLRAPQLAP